MTQPPHPPALTGQAAAAAAEPDLARPTRRFRAGRAAAPRGTAGLTPYLFLLVPVGLLVLLTYTPVVNMFWYSVTDWDGLDKTKNFIGSDNYVEVFTDPDNLRVFYVSLFYRRRALARADGARALLRDDPVVHGAVQEHVEGHPVLPVPHQRGRHRPDLPQLPQARRRARHGPAEDRAREPRPPVDGRPRHRQLLARGGLRLAVHGPDVRDVPGCDPVHQLGRFYEAAALDGANRWQEFRSIPSLPSIRPIVGLAFILGISGSLSGLRDSRSS